MPRRRVVLAIVAVPLILLVGGVGLMIAERNSVVGRTSQSQRASPGSRDGQPDAQCRVTALGVLDQLAQGNGAGLGSLRSATDSEDDHIANVVQANRRDFDVLAARIGSRSAKLQMAGAVQTACNHR